MLHTVNHMLKCLAFVVYPPRALRLNRDIATLGKFIYLL